MLAASFSAVALLGLICIVNIVSQRNRFASGNITIELKSSGEDVARQIAKQAHLRRESRFGLRKLPRLMQVQKSMLSSASQLPLYDQVIAYRKLATYFGEIEIGRNPTSRFKVLFDTGSCEFWVPDESCFADQCAGHQKYKRSAMFSPRFTFFGEPSLMEVEYLSGKLQGYDGFETVYLGDGISVPNATIGFATSIDIPLLAELAWDGIVGLGFKNKEISDRGVKPLDHIVESGSLSSKNIKNQFTYYLSDFGGALTFGDPVPDYMEDTEDEFSWIPVNPSNGYWTVNILRVTKDKFSNHTAWKPRTVAPDHGRTYFHSDGKASIVDTGTYLVYAPNDVMYGLLGDLRVTSCEDKTKLPVITFHFSMALTPGAPINSVIEVPLTPEDYVLQFEGKDGKAECILGISADEAEDEIDLGGWTLGQVFLRSYYTIFDRDNLRIGIVRSRKAPYKQRSNLNKPSVSEQQLPRFPQNGPIL